MIYILIILDLIFLYFLLTYFIFKIVCKNEDNLFTTIILKNVEKTLEPYKDMIDKGMTWFNSKNSKDIYINSLDNLKLKGILIENPKAKGTMILCHGYKGGPVHDLCSSLSNYYDMGFNILLIEQRASNNSEGKYITFGYHESKDLSLWIKYMKDKYKLPIVLGGISMGSTGIMLCLKHNPDIKAAIVDCGFSNGYMEVKYCIKHYFHIPGGLFLPGINYWCNRLGNFDLKKINTVKALEDVRIPILFIHGIADSFVPVINSRINYKYYKGKKDLFLVAEAEHGISYLLEPENYIEIIKEFLKGVL
jgi:hypothetical protein